MEREDWSQREGKRENVKPCTANVRQAHCENPLPTFERWTDRLIILTRYYLVNMMD